MFERRQASTTALLFAILVVVTVAILVSGCGSAATPTSTAIGGVTTTVGAGPVRAGPLDATPYIISVAKEALNATSIEIPLHAGVLFENREDDTTVQHEFLAIGGGFDTGPLDAGVRYLVYFDKEATVSFIDKLHPTLTGKIVVSTSVTAAQVLSPGAAFTPPPGPWIGIREGGPTTMNAQVHTGEAVNFYNAEAKGGVEHHIVADDGSFDSGVLLPNQSFAFTFKQAGTFGYHDVLDSKVKGTITVK
jgi:hypothetical protein